MSGGVLGAWGWMRPYRLPAARAAACGLWLAACLAAPPHTAAQDSSDIAPGPDDVTEVIVGDADVEEAGYPPIEHAPAPRYLADPGPAPGPLTEADWEAVTEGITVDQETYEAPPFDPAMFSGLARWVEVLVYILVGGLLVAALVYFVQRGRRDTSRAIRGREFGLTDELLASSAEELSDSLRGRLAGGDYRGAVRYRFGQLLQELRAAALLRWVPGKTNADYAAELPRGLGDGFEALAAAFAYATYSGRAVGEADYARFDAEATRFALELPAYREPAPRARGTRVRTGLLVAIAAAGLASCDPWERDYDPESENPYGTLALSRALERLYPDSSLVRLEPDGLAAGLQGAFAREAAYLAVAPGLAYTPAEARELLDFAAAGGRVYLAAEVLSLSIARGIATERCLEEGELVAWRYLADTALLTDARGRTYALPAIARQRGSGLHVNTLVRSEACVPKATDLLTISRPERSASVAKPASRAGLARPDSLLVEFDDFGEASYPVLIDVPYGLGAIRVLGSPLLVTNAYATLPEGRGAFAAVLATLPAEPEVLFYDVERQASVSDVNRANYEELYGDRDYRNPSRGLGDTVLRHVLERPALAGAWYATLLGAVLFVLFGAKRRQRVIPIAQERRNATHAYLGNVSRLYLSKPNNARMAAKQLQLFEAYTQRRFGLSPLADPADAERLASLQGVDANFVPTLGRYARTLEREQPLGDESFVQLVRLLQGFYRGTGRRSS